MKKIIITVLISVFIASYAQASTQKSLTEVKALVQKQTGYETSTSNKDDIQKEMEGLLNQPLTEDAAIKIVLLNSPLIKAELSLLGISEADMREAGILHNPTVRFSSRTSNEEWAKRNNEIEFKQDVLDVLFWPLRRNVAGTRFKASQYDAANRITQLVKGVRLSYWEWVAAVHKKALAQDHFKAQEAALELARRQKEAGNINTLQISAAQAVFQKAKIAPWIIADQLVGTYQTAETVGIDAARRHVICLVNQHTRKPSNGCAARQRKKRPAIRVEQNKVRAVIH